jgi:hypothetical protein
MQASLFVSLAVALYAGSLMGLPLSIPPLPPDPVIERAAPEECLAHISLRGVAAPRDGSTNLTEGLLAEAEVKRFLGETGAQILRAGRSPLAAGGTRLAPMAEIAEIVSLLLSRPSALTIDSAQPTANGLQFKGSVVVNAGDAADDLQRALDALLATLPRSQIGQFEYGGQSWSQIAGSAGTPPMNWGFRKQYFVLAIGDKSLEQLLDRLAKKNRSTPAWKQSLETRLSLERVSTFMHIDAAKAVSLVAGLAPAAASASLLKAVGIDRLVTVEGVSGLSETGMASATAFEFSSRPPGASGQGDSGIQPADLRFIPPDAVIAQVLKIDLAKTLDATLESIGTADPAQAAQLRESLEQFRAVAGLDLQKHLLAPLGDVWSVFALPGAGLGVPNLTVTVNLRDSKTLRVSHKAILGVVRQFAVQGAASSTMVIKQDEFVGNTIFTMHFGGDAMIPLTPAWCLTDDRLIVTLSPQLLRTLLWRKQQERSLADVPEVTQTLANGGQVSLLGYQDPTAVMAALSSLFELVSPIARVQLAQQGIDVDPPQLPAWTALQPYARPSVSVVRRESRSIVAEGRATIPLGPLTSGNMLVGSSPMAAGVAVGLMLPAVQAAREAARRSAASNNLKQIALAMLNYESARKRLPSPAICDNTGKPLLSWRVAILPFLDESNLYQQFHRDEPWDSEHNKQLLLKMPPLYQSPDALLAEGRTVYMLPVGENTLFPSADTGPTLMDIRDGTSKTLMAVETTADRAVPWTKPDDFEVDPKNPLAGLAGARSGGFLAVFVDGHSSLLPADIDVALLRALISPAGDEAVDPP